MVLPAQLLVHLASTPVRLESKPVRPTSKLVCLMSKLVRQLSNPLRHTQQLPLTPVVGTKRLTPNDPDHIRHLTKGAVVVSLYF